MTQDPILEFDCPRCGTPIHSVGNHDWEDVRCPNCHQMVTCPSGDQRSNDSALNVGSDPDWKQVEPDDLEELAPDQDSDSTIGLNEIFGITCHVCDTRVHVRNDQIGTTVQCPDCYTNLTVERPRPKKRKWTGVAKPEDRPGQASFRTDSLDDELKLEDEFERPRMGPGYGLQAEDDASPLRSLDDAKQPVIVGDDLPELAPLDNDSSQSPQDHPADSEAQMQAANETFERLQLPEENDIADLPPPQSTSPAKTGQPLSRRERLEQAQRKQQENESRGNDPFGLSADDADVEFPSFDQASLFNATLFMLKSRGLWWRVLAASGLMLVGALVKEQLWPDGTQTSDFDGETGSFFVQAFLALVLGAAPYAIGLAGLWLAAAFVFRDAAMGRRQVHSWKTTGTEELMGTFLIFGFSFFVAGIMGVFAGPLTIPLRVLVAPVFLLAAWYNRSFWSIASLDVFSQFQELSRQWGQCYSWMSLLAVTGLLAGLLFWMRGFIESSIVCAMLTFIGVVLSILVTLVFAAISGWHAGKIVTFLNRS